MKSSVSRENTRSIDLIFPKLVTSYQSIYALWTFKFPRNYLKLSSICRSMFIRVTRIRSFVPISCSFDMSKKLGTDLLIDDLLLTLFPICSVDMRFKASFCVGAVAVLVLA